MRPRNRNYATDIRVAAKDIGNYGATPGYPACENVTDNRKLPSGLRHSKACMERIRECIAAHGDIQERVVRAKERQAKSGNQHITKLQTELHRCMLDVVPEGIDVAEVYSPPRVAKRATELGLPGGWGFRPHYTGRGRKSLGFLKGR